MRTCSVIALLVAFTSCATQRLAADDWPAWRGAGRAVSPTTPPPTVWDESHQICWKTAIPGTGHSSPIVSGDSILVTTALVGVSRDAESRYQAVVGTSAIVAAIVGFVLIQIMTRARYRPLHDAATSNAIPTASTLTRIVPWCVAVTCAVAAGMIARQWVHPDISTLRFVICVDRQTGRIRWQTECSASPLLGTTALTSAATPTPTTDGRHIFAHFGVAGTYCLDFDGAIQWANHDPTPEILYKAGSSPILWNDLLIVTHDTDRRSYTVALDKQIGAARWTAERNPPTEGRRERRDAYSTPIVVRIGDTDQLVHDSYRRITGYDPATGRELWIVPTEAEQIVTSPVANGDIVIFAGECNHPIHMTAIRLTTADGTTTPVTLWQSNKQVPVVSSPAIHEGRVYAVSKSGIATCRDVETGEMIWRHRLPGKHYASITIAGGNVYLPNLDGVTTVMAATDEARVMSTNTLDEPIYASPAVCDGELFFRGTGHLYCIRDTTGIMALD